MGRKRTLKQAVRFSFIGEQEEKDRIERQRWYQSQIEGRYISFSEFMRRMINVCCPKEQTEIK
jgi:hypothetical protein